MNSLDADMRNQARTSAVISDPTRARLLQLILAEPDGRSTVTRLARQLDLRQPTVTHHAKVLTDAGVLTRRPEGRQAWYAVAPDHLDLVSDLVGADVASSPDAAAYERIVDDLSTRFAGTFNRETIDRCVRDSSRLLAASGTATRLASRTAAFTAQRLAATATPTHDDVPRVLFVCVQNAGRSQMAAALLRHLAGERVRVWTAGSMPGARVAPAVVNVLDEIGVPVSGEFPKPLTDDVVRAASVVITMGCGDACPVHPGTRYLDWDLDDPVGRPLDEVRGIRDDIERRVRALIRDLEQSGP